MRKKIVFMGSDEIALPMLNCLAGEFSSEIELLAVYTQPDRPAGRGNKLRPNDIKKWATERAVPVRQPEKLKKAEREWLADQGCDLIIVMAYGHFLGQRLLDTPPLGCVNLHGSILPKYRGASPIQTAMALGEPGTGVSLMRMELAMDAGPVADIERVRIAASDTAPSLWTKMAEACVPLMRRNLPALLEGRLPFVEQDLGEATYCRRLSKADGALDFRRPASELDCRVRAFTPWPGSSFVHEGEQIRVAGASVLSGEKGEPGEVLGLRGEGLAIATGEGGIAFAQLQRPTKRMLPARDVLRGFPIADGTILSSADDAPLLVEG